MRRGCAEERRCRSSDEGAGSVVSEVSLRTHVLWSLKKLLRPLPVRMPRGRLPAVFENGPLWKQAERGRRP